MKKIVIVLAALALGGCSYKQHSAPGFGPGGATFASADYTVLGETSAEACGTYVFGIDFGHLFVDKAGSVSGGGGGDPLSMILVMIGLVFIIHSSPWKYLGLPGALIFYLFEVVIVVTIQAYIFAALSAIYIGSAVEPEH